MKKYAIIFLLIGLLCSQSTTQAEELLSSSNFNSYTLGDINGQGAWAVTKYDGASLGSVNITTSDTAPDEKFGEITNNHSILVTHIDTPRNAGVLEFKMRHNKVGLFYLYAQTSDAGGQLLFSIQFTASKGILIEEEGKQTTLLSDYNVNQWYDFTIDFDNARGKSGTFKIKIDNGDNSEHEYVNSESETFDLAQLTFGSESDGQTAVSGFSEMSALSQLKATTTATSTVSDSLLQLSISLATSSITANLDDGRTVVASLDGNPQALATTSSSTVAGGTTSVGQFLLSIVAHVVDVLTPETKTPAPLSPTTTQPIPDSVPVENAIPSTIQIDSPHNDVTTTTF